MPASCPSTLTLRARRIGSHVELARHRRRRFRELDVVRDRGARFDHHAAHAGRAAPAQFDEVRAGLQRDLGGCQTARLTVDEHLHARRIGFDQNDAELDFRLGRSREQPSRRIDARDADDGDAGNDRRDEPALAPDAPSPRLVRDIRRRLGRVARLGRRVAPRLRLDRDRLGRRPAEGAVGRAGHPRADGLDRKVGALQRDARCRGHGGRHLDAWYSTRGRHLDARYSTRGRHLDARRPAGGRRVRPELEHLPEIRLEGTGVDR